MDALTGFLAMLAFVFFKAFQQRNVAFDNYVAVLPTSILMAATEFYVIALIVKTGYDITLVLALGTGAGIGALIAMYLHKRVFGTKGSTSTSLSAQGTTEVRK
jgi:hypothetical protein